MSVTLIIVSQSEQAAGPAVEETNKQPEQNKVCVTRSTTNHNKLMYIQQKFKRLCVAVPINIEMKNIVVKAWKHWRIA